VPLLLVFVLISALAGPASSSEPAKDQGKGLELVANIPYLGGTDMELATIKGRDYAFAASAPLVGESKVGAFRVIDVTDPTRPKVVATLPCSLYQADVQLSHDLKTVVLAADAAGGVGSCLAFGKAGFMTIDISNPRRPRAIGFADTGGSHNTTAHPKLPLVYNSGNSFDPMTGIQIWSIADPARPKLVKVVTSLPESSHDISFNKDGTRMVTASYEHFDIFDTSDARDPKLLMSSQCPGCVGTHDAKFTPDGSTIVVGEESGGGEAYPCPGGALYFYSLAGGQVPVLVGAYEPDEFVFATEGQGGLEGCTSHVFDITEDSKYLAVSWYSAGVRYLDISSITGPTVGATIPGGVKEIGWFIGENSLSWSSKFHKGPYIFANDKNRGFDVLRITD
jgi:hypothetical protein